MPTATTPLSTEPSKNLTRTISISAFRLCQVGGRTKQIGGSSRLIAMSLATTATRASLRTTASSGSSWKWTSRFSAASFPSLPSTRASGLWTVFGLDRERGGSGRGLSPLGANGGSPSLLRRRGLVSGPRSADHRAKAGTGFPVSFTASILPSARWTSLTGPNGPSSSGCARPIGKLCSGG